MKLEEVLPILRDRTRKGIRRPSLPGMVFIIGSTGEGPELVTYDPKSTMPPFRSSFDIADLLADDWEAVE